MNIAASSEGRPPWASVLLLPLDDRPVSVSLPSQIAGIAGVEVKTPGRDLRPHFREVPVAGGLAEWFARMRTETHAAVVSLDALACGSLIGSRLDDRSAAEMFVEWRHLTRPGPPVHAAIVVPRAPGVADATEEPHYWDPHGPGLHALSTELSDGSALDEALERVPRLPRDVVRDWLSRRLRQHAMALGALDLHRRALLQTLVIGVDDATPHSLSAVAQRDLQRWAELTGPPEDVFVHPGADETGAALMARAVLGLSGQRAPRIAIVSHGVDTLTRIAPYETTPVGMTAERQLMAAGAQITHDLSTADAVVVVHPPAVAPFDGDWALSPPERTDATSANATAGLAARLMSENHAVAIADVAHPNGGDPALSAALSTEGLWQGLLGYAGWNTAGNSLGTVAAQLVATLTAQSLGTLNTSEHRAMMARRIVEDLGWMSLIRTKARREIGSDPGRHDVVTPTCEQRGQWESDLSEVLQGVGGFSDMRVEAGSLRLPWNRTFELDVNIDHGSGRAS